MGLGGRSARSRMSVDDRAKARMSVRFAREKFARAKQEAKNLLNEFARDPDGDLELQGKLAQMASPNASWYSFWERPTKVPERLKLWNGEQVAWQVAAASMLEEVLQAAEEPEETDPDADADAAADAADALASTAPASRPHLVRSSGRRSLRSGKSFRKRKAEAKGAEGAEGAQDDAVRLWSAPQKVFWTGPMTWARSEVRGSRGVPFLRLTVTLEVPPRALLLTQIRAEFRGRADPALVYMREHYTFRDDKTLLFHSIEAAPASLCSPRDYCDVVSWDEHPDGTIVIAAQSVANCGPQRAVAGAVRAQSHLRGLVIRPKKVVHRSLLGAATEVRGCEVTYVLCVDLKGWMPRSITNMGQKKAAGNFLLESEKVAKEIIASGKADKLIRKHIRHQVLT